MSKAASDGVWTRRQSNDDAVRLAGVTLQHISDRPPYPFHDGTMTYSHLAALEDLYGKAQGHFTRVGFAPDFRGSPSVKKAPNPG